MTHPADDDDCRDYWQFVLTVMAEQAMQEAEEREKNQDSPSRDDHGDKEEEKK